MEIKYCDRVSGKGLFSTKVYKKGEIIFILKGEILNEPTKYTIRIGDNKHILDDFGIYMNHSFNPTALIEGNNVIATRDISDNEELNFNYNDSEINMSSPFEINGEKVTGKTVNKTYETLD